MSAEEKKANVKVSKREYKCRVKKVKSKSLHPDSIAMENPHFVPELIHPTGSDIPMSPQDW